MGTAASTIPENVLRLFWDADKTRLDIERHAKYIICRVLDYGDSPEVSWLFDTYGEETIRLVIASNPPLHPKTANYWRTRFGMANSGDLLTERVADGRDV